MTTTPLPLLPEPYSLAHEDAGSFWPDTYSESQMQAYATQARADLEAEVVRLREALSAIERKDALLRQCLDALETDDWLKKLNASGAITKELSQ